MASFGHSLINREQYELVRLGLLIGKQPGRLHCSQEQLFSFSVKISAYNTQTVTQIYL